MKFIYKYTRVLTSYYIIQQQQQWMQHANETFIYCIREQQQQQILNQTFKTHSNEKDLVKIRNCENGNQKSITKQVV